MSRANNEGRSRSGSTSNLGSGSRRHGESSTSAGGSRTLGSQEDQDTQLQHHWAFVIPTLPHDNASIAICLYYPGRKAFSKPTFVTFKRCYKDTQSRTLVMEVNPN